MESKKAVIMLCGNPATGKTVSSQKIYENLIDGRQIVLLTTLSIRSSLKLTDLKSKESRDKVYNKIAKYVDTEFSKGKEIIILDGNFNKKSRRQGIYDAAKKYNADIFIVLCKVDTIQAIKERMEQRKKNPHNIQNKADNLELYKLIDKETEPVEEDTINGKKLKTIVFDTEKSKIELRNCNNLDNVQKEIIEHIKDSLLTKTQGKMSGHYKAIIFDIGGVIQNLRWEVVANQLIDLKRDLNMDMFRSAFYYQRENYFNLYETHKMKSEDFWKMVASQLGLSEKAAGRISKAFISLYDPVNIDIANIIKNLKQKYKLIIMSNSCPELKENVESNDFYDIFDKKYFSYDTGLKKPNKDFFEHVLKENNLKAEECIFVDDAPKNVDSANEIGMKGILYLSPNQLKAELNNLK